MSNKNHIQDTESDVNVAEQNGTAESGGNENVWKEPEPVKQGSITPSVSYRGTRKRFSLTTRRNLMGYWFVLPFVLGILWFYVPALIEALRFSFSDIIIGGDTYKLESVGWSNYNEIITVDPDFIRNIFETTGTMLLNVVIILIYSLIMATVLNRNIAGKSFYRAMLFLPVIISTGIITKSENIAMVHEGSAALDMEAGAVAGGLFSELDISLILNSLNMSTELTNIVASAVNNIYTIVTCSGVQLIIFLAGLQSISPAIYESATVEGATWWEGFWKITIPMISPLILVNMVYTVVDSFTRYGNTVMDGIFAEISAANYSLASARSFVYLIVVGVIVALVIGVVNRFVFYENK